MRPARWCLLVALPTWAVTGAAHAQSAPPPAVEPAPPPGYMPPPGSPAPTYHPPPPPGPPKTHSDPDRGHVVGASVGVGTYSYYGCGDLCGNAWMGELHLGGLLTEGLALEGDLWSGFHAFSDPRAGGGKSISSIWTLALQYWFEEILWVKAGIGVGHLQATNGDVGTALAAQTTIAFLVAFGIEVYRTYHYAIDVQVRCGSAPYSGVDDDPVPVAALLGVSWR